MNESSRTTTCPTWCTSDHDAANDWPQWHYGPSFGHHLQVGEFNGVAGGLLDDCDADDLSPAELRQLAADALVAAEWLEAEQ